MDLSVHKSWGFCCSQRCQNGCVSVSRGLFWFGGNIHTDENNGLWLFISVGKYENLLQSQCSLCRSSPPPLPAHPSSAWSDGMLWMFPGAFGWTPYMWDGFDENSPARHLTAFSCSLLLCYWGQLGSSFYFAFIHLVCMWIYVYTHVRKYPSMHVEWKLGKNWREPVLSSYHVGPRDWTRGVQLGGRQVNLLGHLWVLDWSFKLNIGKNWLRNKYIYIAHSA